MKKRSKLSRRIDESIPAHIETLRKRIEANKARLREAEAFYAQLKPIFDKYPGITTGEAIALLNQEKIGQDGKRIGGVSQG